MPLAAIGLFVMVLGVLATLNLGQAVYEKIKLQNTADSAAYSLAAMEARTFNYIAFLNRVQIAHYNTAMVVQSYMTWVGFQVAIQETAGDLMVTLKNAAYSGTQLPYPANIPYIPLYAIAQGLAAVAQASRQGALAGLTILEKAGHPLIEAMSIFNKDVIWQMQRARAILLNGHITTAMMSYVHKNDPDIPFGSGGLGGAFNLGINAALNSLEYYQSFSSGPGENPFWMKLITDWKRTQKGGEYTDVSDDGAKDAYRVMTELCHATRTPRFVSNRGPGAGQYGIGWMLLALVSGSKMGQTKFTEDGEVESDSAEIKAIGDEENYALGRHLSSDDFLRTPTGFATLGLVNVMYTGAGKAALGDAIDAYEEDGAHYRYDSPDDETGTISPGSSDVIVAFPVPQGGHSTTEGTTDEDSGTGGGNHAPWPGFAPYYTFKASSDRTRDFNQPSTWMFLNKSHEKFQTKGFEKPWYMKVSWENGEQKAELDTTIGGERSNALERLLGLPLQGLTAMSRGMAYYHRPGEGNWKEHPNFFNPFWRARLAPVGQKLQAFWDRYVTQNMTSDSDSAILQGALSFLRNAQMDFMTSFITSLVTH